ncbi:MAG TPA: nuclear transport factor 2 family protein [Vicinamibacterales bacterium]|nr:nuclear transport factor 2 family protein [Vicinamibacterales bacterium]
MVIELALALAIGQATDASAARRELEAIEHQLAATWQKGDCAAWASFIAPDWSVIHITGEVITRAEALEMCKAPRTEAETYDIGDISVRRFGDTAVVTGRTTASSGGSKPGTLTLRFTDVFVHVKGRWQVVASHATRVGPSPAR